MEVYGSGGRSRTGPRETLRRSLGLRGRVSLAAGASGGGAGAGGAGADALPCAGRRRIPAKSPGLLAAGHAGAHPGRSPALAQAGAGRRTGAVDVSGGRSSPGGRGSPLAHRRAHGAAHAGQSPTRGDVDPAVRSGCGIYGGIGLSGGPADAGHAPERLLRSSCPAGGTAGAVRSGTGGRHGHGRTPDPVGAAGGGSGGCASDRAGLARCCGSTPCFAPLDCGAIWCSAPGTAATIASRRRGSSRRCSGGWIGRTPSPAPAGCIWSRTRRPYAAARRSGQIGICRSGSPQSFRQLRRIGGISPAEGSATVRPRMGAFDCNVTTPCPGGHGACR